MPAVRKQYPFDVIEAKWQRHWLDNKTFKATEPSPKPKYYVLDMFPYPSGAGLHVGHPEGYTATDILARHKRMRGFNVLHPMGWDAFGLPAEQYAIDTGTHPAVQTQENINTFRRQIQMLGFSYDWDREVDTTDPEYFKWTQWIFLQLYNSYFDTTTNQARPIALLEDALSDKPDRQDEWAADAWLAGLHRDFVADDPSKREKWRRPLIDTWRLACEAEVPVWWCEGCKAVLSNEEVKNDGTCERRGHSGVYRRPLRQWLLRIRLYAERLLKDLDSVDWPSSTREQQINWIGRSEGADVAFGLIPSHVAGDAQVRSFLAKGFLDDPRNSNLKHLGVFTTRPDTLFGATYLVLAPEHRDVDSVTTMERRSEVDAYRTAASRKSELERGSLEKEKTGVFTGGYAANPVTGEPIPIWIADYVLMGYGTGAIMAVPAHDERDREFAERYGLSIQKVIEPSNKDGFTWERVAQGAVKDAVAPKPASWVSSILVDRTGKVLVTWDERKAFEFEGEAAELVSSQNAELSMNGRSPSEAKRLITEFLERKGVGRVKVQYKLRDWLFSRQRYWGEPIPIVHCGKCGAVALPENELPLRLPELKDYSPTGNAEPPLAKATDWVNTKCPKCGGPAKRETNTMPQWAGSCWYYLRYIEPKNPSALVAKEKEQYWQPVDLYVGGAEHAVLHLLYSRFWHKVLFDLGHVSTPEPFRKLVHQGMILGEDNAKMSKSRGNVINPDEVVREYGADSFRLYEMFMGPLEMVKPWSMRGVEGVYRFLGRVWRLFVDEQSDRQYQDEVTAGTRRADDLGCLKISGVIRQVEPSAAQLKLLHATIKKVTQDLDAMAFNTAISQMMVFVNETMKIAQSGQPLAKPAMEQFVLVLSPFAPHLSEELWRMLGHNSTLAYESWPTWDEKHLAEDIVEVVVQVNGRVRDRVSVPAAADDETVKAQALASEKVKTAMAGKQPKNVIVIPGKLVNIVIE